MNNITVFTAGADIANECSRAVTTYIFKNADRAAYESKKAQIVSGGFEMMNERSNKAYTYSDYLSENIGVFMYHYPSISEITVVVEKNTAYFSYSDTPRAAAVTPQITQIELEDFGMSYPIRLSDGRYIVIDGGRALEYETNKLYKALKAGSIHEKPVIAAWILSHPHSDHFFCFNTFMKKYGSEVEVEKVMFNFPDADDEFYAKALSSEDKRFCEGSASENITKMLDIIDSFNLPVYTPHTGQTYKIGDAVLEFISTMDDTKHITPNVNATSLVFRMELAGQVILWTNDASIGFARLPDKYGDYLKCDILQIPHHGFQCGSPDEEIRGYMLMQPETCLLPVADYTAYNFFSALTKSTGFLYRNIGFSEVISGTPQRTISLPYTPPPYARAETLRKFTDGVDSCGARTWVFTNLRTDRPEDFKFSVVNFAIPIVDVIIELYFDEPSTCVRNIRAQFPRCQAIKIDIRDYDKDPKSPFSAFEALKVVGIPENTDFSVRFICSDPVVISHKDHQPAYHSGSAR